MIDLRWNCASMLLETSPSLRLLQTATHHPLRHCLNILLHRELYPTLLKKGDRGKFHDITNIPGQYGEQVRLLWERFLFLFCLYHTTCTPPHVSMYDSSVTWNPSTPLHCASRWWLMVLQEQTFWINTRGGKLSWTATVSSHRWLPLHSVCAVYFCDHTFLLVIALLYFWFRFITSHWIH